MKVTDKDLTDFALIKLSPILFPALLGLEFEPDQVNGNGRHCVYEYDYEYHFDYEFGRLPRWPLTKSPQN